MGYPDNWNTDCADRALGSSRTSRISELRSRAVGEAAAEIIEHEIDLAERIKTQAIRLEALFGDDDFKIAFPVQGRDMEELVQLVSECARIDIRQFEARIYPRALEMAKERCNG